MQSNKQKKYAFIRLQPICEICSESGQVTWEDAQSRQYRHLLLEDQSTNSENYNKLQI